MVVAALRPDSWDFPLLLHVFGAMVLVGAVFTAGLPLLAAWRPRETVEAVALRRFAFRTLLVLGLPAWLLMRIGGEWIASRENLDEVEPDPDWLGIGYVVGDLSLLLLVAAIIAAGIGSRRAERVTLGRVAAVLTLVLLAAYLVAVWAMTAKP